MSSNIYRLEELVDLKIGRTPPRKEKQWFSNSEGIRWISIRDLGESGKYVYQTNERLTHEAVQKFNVPIIPKDTLVLSFKLTVGKLAFTAEDMASNEAIAQLPIRDKRITNNDYLYYYLLNYDFNNLGGTSSIAFAVNSNTLRNIKVDLPDVEKQNKIAKILGDLDRKIELNRKMNETLEQMGQALFKHYFVDDAEAKEWGMTTLRAMVSPQRGRSLQRRDMRDGCIPVVSGGLEPSGYHDESNTIAPVITISASGANAGYIRLWHNPIWSADSSFIDKRNTDYVYFFYIFLKTKQKDIYSARTGAAQPHIYPSHLERLEIQMIPEEKIKEFCALVEPLFVKMGNLERENQTISNLRDLLLPKLLSGEIKV